MSSIEKTGKVVSISELITVTYGDNQSFTKKTIAIEDTDDKFNDALAFEIGDKKFDILNNITVGQLVKVSGNLGSKESKKKDGTYYTSLKAWKIEAMGAAVPAPEQSATSESGSDIPF